MNKKIFFLVGPAILFAAIGAVYFALNRNHVPETKNVKTENLFATSTDNLFNRQAAASKSQRYSGQSLNFLADPKILSQYPQEFVEKNRARLINAVNLIGKNPEAVEYWIEVGVLKKFFNNYSGARDAWEYAKSVVAPRNPIAYFDLGNLYGLYLKDFKRAESNYQMAINLDPNDANHYLGLADLYKNFYREKANQTADVLLLGLRVLPYDPNLILDLAFYYKSIGDKEDAIKYFERFLTVPDQTGAQTKAIEGEITALKNQDK